ncbi:arylsulfatase [Aquimarina sp. 2201CG5-10]|uniref:arylsulfatase n=1 Tax=Aquimarina callyspongiae TaxID=3098150 RepID=UPI002AB479E5|nr:arylsulfatase [Aquimarina sp. 2201CG5-10]MDY8134172.1 arylsulfatase [Aquimarina sp. 2201CG5-10]
MKLISYVSYSLLIFSIIISCNTKKEQKEPEKPIKAKPNIIYILADDLGYGEVGVYGQTKIETPNIDNLAKEGMLFTQHYSGAPVCAPARSVLLTGKHMGHSYIRGNDEWDSRGEKGDVWNYKKVIKDSTLEGQRPLPVETMTIAKMLKKSGYKTGMIGKWGLGAPHTTSIPTNMGFDYFFGYNCQRQAHTYNPVHLYENENRYYLENDTIPPRTALKKGEDPYAIETYSRYNQPVYSSAVSFDKLMGFVKENQEDPFFLYWASPIPHLPLQAPKKWVDHYVDKFGDEEPYYFVEGEKRGSYFPTRYPHATYAAMVSYLDENIGKLVDYLKKEGLYDNTLILFTSDNGPSYTGGTDSPWFKSGGPFDSEYGRGKGFLHEGGIRVPMIASWPDKIKKGTRTDHISAFWDVMPTLSEVVGIDPPKDADGISFYNTITNKSEQKTHPYLYWEYPEYGGQAAVRIGKWKIIWKDIKKGNKEIELYNLEEDLKERNNIAKNHPEIVEKLFQIIKTEHTPPQIERFRIDPIEEIFNTR